MTNGFTLIEILIVIAIIGILAAALLFNSVAALRSGRVTAAQNHGRQVSLAVAQWLGQQPLRTGDALNGLNCAQPYTLTVDGPTSGYTSGALGWEAPKVATVTCTIQGTGRSVDVLTTTDGKTFKNGNAQ